MLLRQQAHRSALFLLVLISVCGARPCPPNAVFMYSKHRLMNVCVWLVQKEREREVKGEEECMHALPEPRFVELAAKEKMR